MSTNILPLHNTLFVILTEKSLECCWPNKKNFLLSYVYKNINKLIFVIIYQLVPRAVDIAIDEDVEFRKSLPRDYLNYMGVAFSDDVSITLCILSQVFDLEPSTFEC